MGIEYFNNPNSGNEQHSQQYWQQSVPPVPQDAASAKQRYWDGQAPPTQAWQVPGNTNQTVPNPPTQQPCVSSKDHVAAGLLGIFLGGFGIHKFYLGYTTAGFIMLGVSILGSLVTLGLAGGVMGIIGFVEGIIYLVKSQSQFTQEYVCNRKEWF